MPVDIPLPVDTAMANASSISRSRAQSASSDRPSTVGVYGLMSPPLPVSPEAAFIATSAASQIVTSDHDTQSGTWYDQVGLEPPEETAVVSNGALQLANSFIDQLLFNVLATAKSTALPSLRSAVTDVLKPKLAKDVVNLADEELREYLGGGEIENLARSASREAARDWDLELVWKRTRLRCMVYSSLGDMEEEDEDYYVEQEHLNGETNDALSELVSPAVAIFLTSILEYMGEQVLVVAGQAAFNRLRVRYEKELRDGARLPGDVSDRIVVEESDMERVALDRTFGRLWRAWKKRIRSPMEPNFSRPFSRSSANGSVTPHQRHGSIAAEHVAMPLSPELNIAADAQPDQVNSKQDRLHDGIRNEDAVLEPSALPLPDSDVEATYSDEESEPEEILSRPKSWVVTTHSPEVGNSFTSHPSIARRPSLPSRKKPRYNLGSPPEGASDANDDGAEHVEVGQVLDSTEAKIEDANPAQDNIETGAWGTVVVEGPPGPGPAPAATDVTTPAAEAKDEIDNEIEEFVEEPEIMTSSRVSIEGASSPTFPESGRPSSFILTRSNSVHSVRVIEVQGYRSRASSIESNPRSPTPRSLNISREGSISKTPPIVEENDPYAIPSVTVTDARPEGPSSTDSSRDAGATLVPPPRNRSPRSIPSPIESHTSAPTKASAIANTTSPPQGEHQESFQRSTSGMKNPPMPTLPERSPSRPVYVQATSTQRALPESPKLARPIQSESPSPARLKPTRTSEDSNLNRPDDVARNFEELIQSNETLQYTLTPENMRNIDSQPPPPPPSQKKRRSAESKNSERSRSSSIKRSISINKSTGLGSHPPSGMMANGKYGNAASKGFPPVSSRNRMPPPQARDARVPRESIQDFADFIRSTGPPGANITRTTGSPVGSLKTARNTMSSPPVPKSSSSSMEPRRGPKLQARDAIVNTSSESSELIDFIRQGPPSTNGNDHRIPRTVAPFRNTQDSDYMTSAVGGKAIDAIIPNVRTSQASTNITEASAPSSMNSQTALLNKTNRQQLHMVNSFDEDDMVPKRTRRRVRDPYAIDFSDEEDDEFEVLPKPPVRQEESLIDFLNNYAPPPEPPTQPIIPPKKKASAPNLIARLRSGSSAGAIGSGHSRKASTVSDTRSVSSRAGSKGTHTPIVIPTSGDRYGSPLKSPNLPRASSFKRLAAPKGEAREAPMSTSQSADLATFLRDVRPPTSMASFSSAPEDKASTGFSRMFERRKKPTAY